MSALTLYVVVYGILAVGHLAIQLVLGHAEPRRQRELSFDPSCTRTAPADDRALGAASLSEAVQPG